MSNFVVGVIGTIITIFLEASAVSCLDVTIEKGGIGAITVNQVRSDMGIRCELGFVNIPVMECGVRHIIALNIPGGIAQQDLLARITMFFDP